MRRYDPTISIIMEYAHGSMHDEFPEEVKEQFIYFVNNYFDTLSLNFQAHQHSGYTKSMMNPISKHVYLPSVVDFFRKLQIPEVNGDSLGSLLDNFSSINFLERGEYQDGLELESQWLSHLDLMMSISERIQNICKYWLDNQPQGMRTPNYLQYDQHINDLNKYAKQMHSAFLCCKDYHYEYNYESNPIITHLATQLNPVLFWKCFWNDGTQLFCDASPDFFADNMRENNEKISLLMLIERPIQQLLFGYAEQCLWCRNSLQKLLDDLAPLDSVKKMDNLAANDSVSYALQITGIILVPRRSDLSEGTLSAMGGVRYQRQPNEVFMPPLL